MPELDQLIADQRRDDTTYVDPQRFAGERSASLEKFVELGLDVADDGIETVRAATGDERPGVWRPNRVHPIHRPRTGRQVEALELGVKPFIDGMTFDKADAVRLVFFGWFSYRTAARMLGLKSPGTVFLRLRGRDWPDEQPHTPGAFDVLRERIEAASGSEGQDFPPTRPFDDTDRCTDQESDWCMNPNCTTYRCDVHFRPPVCSGHFVDTVCDIPGCGTVLPRHYNPHTSCRVHARGRTTRYDHNLTFLVDAGLSQGRSHAAGRRARSAAARQLPQAVAS